MLNENSGWEFLVEMVDENVLAMNGNSRWETGRHQTRMVGRISDSM